MPQPDKPYTRIDIEELLDRIDLADLVTWAGAKLEPHHGEYRGNCPLHNGSNPTAFQVYQDGSGRWRWRCWGQCDKGGDALAFVQARENITDFLEAVRWLADWGHIPAEDIGLSPEAETKMCERQARSDVLDLAARFAADRLWSDSGSHALAYARSRGFPDDVIRLAGFGFLDGSTALLEHLTQAGADLDLARKLGLVRKDGGDFTANAKGREAAPTGWLIYTHRRYPNAHTKKCETCQAETWHVGDTCLRHNHTLEHIRKVGYLSARAISPADPDDKSRNLPGERQVYKAEVPGVKAVIVCEGQADAESYRTLGFTAWGLCGLGHLSPEDLAELRRRPVVYLALDGDEAGQKKQGALAQAIGPLVMLLPPFENAKDANAYLQAGGSAEGIQQQFKLATPWIEIQLNQVSKASPHELQALTGEIAELLKYLPAELRPRYFRQAERKLRMSRGELRHLINEMDTARSDGELTICRIQDGRLEYLGEPLSNFWVKIVKELILDDGLNPPVVRYTLGGQLATGETLRTIEVDAEEFATLNWIGKYWGARPIVYVPGGKRHLFTRAIQEVSAADMARERVFTHTGWTLIDGQRSFLSASGRITAEGFDTDVRVELDHNLRYYALPEPPNGKELVEGIRISLGFLDLAPLHVTAPIWAAVYAAAMNEIAPLYTVPWVYGTTQSGKSVIMHLALTHFGPHFIDGRKYHAPCDWMSTFSHLEESMFAAKDVLLVIDDFAPQFHSADDSRKMGKLAQLVVRAVGNRSSRGRSRKYQDRTLTPRGMVISTAELPLPGESTVGRMLYVPIARGDVLPEKGERPREALNQAQALAGQGAYARAMSVFIRWLAANWDKAAAKFQEANQDALHQIRDVQNRLPDYYAHLNAAAQVALMSFYELGAISASECADKAAAIEEALKGVIVGQAERIAAESPVRKFFDALDNLLTRRKVYIAPRTKSVVFTPPSNADLIGWSDAGDDVVYIDDVACLAHVRAHWSGMGENFDTTTDALRRQVSQIAGLLAEKDAHHVQVSKYIAGKTRRALAVSRKAVMSAYGAVLENESSESETKAKV
jgi:DNA primase